MKRRNYAQNRIITVSNEIDEYGAHCSGQVNSTRSVRTFRQVQLSKLQQPITLPRWSRNVYRSYDTPTVPQLAPEIRVLPMDELVFYEGGEDTEQVEIDPDSQVDVCALEENDNAADIHTDVTHEEDIPSKRARPDIALVKEEKGDAHEDVVDEGGDAVHGLEPPPRSERYRILRRSTGGETLAARARREAAQSYPNDDVMAEFNDVMGDGSGEMVQEEVEVVDHDENLARYIYPQPHMITNRRTILTDPRQLVNLNDLYEEMTSYAPVTADDAFNEVFGTESNMSHQLNAKSLMKNVKLASAEQNAKIIAAMAMQINYMKREISRLREDLVDIRSATIMRQNYGLTSRTFDLNAPVSREWYIPEDPPLMAVDLVKTAREVSLRIGRKNMKTRDVITRFVRAVFDHMIPVKLVRGYTVRDRPSTRAQSKDIGGRAKDQITGIVLDLMGLYDGETLTGNARVDRANFSDFVNSAMKTVIYDMRRLSPKSRKIIAHPDSNQSIDVEDLSDDFKP